jgi:predicted RNase H-like HicB family nuclease
MNSAAPVREYTVILEKGPNNWSAYVPDLPGCIATGDTREEVLDVLREAIEFHLEGMRLNGERVPEPTTESARVAVAAIDERYRGGSHRRR